MVILLHNDSKARYISSSEIQGTPSLLLETGIDLLGSGLLQLG
jgi:hypothetical protein